jgi:hypothetical protein
MEWIKTRVSLALRVYAHHKILFTIFVVICGIIGAFDPISAWIRHTIKSLSSTLSASSSEGSAMMFGFPSWQVGVMLLLFVCLLAIFEYAVFLQKQLTPTLQMYAESVIVPTDVYARDQLGNITIDHTRSSWVRIRLESKTRAIVRDCNVYIIKIEKKTIPTAPFTELPMGNAVRLTNNGINVPPRVPQTVDVFSSGENENTLVFRGIGYSLLLKDAFVDRTTYRFEIIAIIGAGSEKVLTMEMDWSGKWDEINIREV